MDNGLQMRTFLEPSAGIGGFLPVAMPDTRGYAFEKIALRDLSCRFCMIRQPR